jgi:outer membrane protein assembly factor BamE (lipoprotein component of BamABCDE complex)
MKLMTVFVVLLTAFSYSGCETPGAAYVKQHPELSPAQRKIFIEKKITDVHAVAGLTKEQLRVALGEPTQFDNIEGDEAWIYLRSGSGAGSVSRLGVAGGDLGGMAPAQMSSGTNAGNVRTTIFFDGDQATRAIVAHEE